MLAAANCYCDASRVLDVWMVIRDNALSDEEDDEQSDSTLLTAFLSMIVISLGNRLFGKLETYPMYA